MSGLYIHIPFCKQECSYCNFHFSTLQKYRPDVLKALEKEIVLRKNELENKKLQTIYFGGGSPSILSNEELNSILETIYSNFDCSDIKEQTIECNPDDLSEERLSFYLEKGFNRLSIGIQSFFDEDLIALNRIHNSEAAKDSVRLAQQLGFKNISVDLMFALPNQTKEKLNENVERALELDIQHISIYGLTIEDKTQLKHQLKTGVISIPTEEESAEMFSFLMDKLQQNGFHQYEISNFSKSGCEAVHNSNYWNGTPYLGIGPSAHSFDGVDRKWNIYNNHEYIRKINANEAWFEVEKLSQNEKYNDLIMTRLRTAKGCDKEKVKELFGENFHQHLTKESQKFIEKGLMAEKEKVLILEKKGKLLADHIISELFLID